MKQKKAKTDTIMDRVEAYIKLAEMDVRLEHTNDLFGPRFYLTSKHYFDEFCPSWNADCKDKEAKTADAALSLAKLRAVVATKLMGMDTFEVRHEIKRLEEGDLTDWKQWVRDYVAQDTEWDAMIKSYGLAEYQEKCKKPYTILDLQKFLDVCHKAETYVYVSSWYQGHHDILYKVYDGSGLKLHGDSDPEEGSYHSCDTDRICSILRALFVVAHYGCDVEAARKGLPDEAYQNTLGVMNWQKWAFDTLHSADSLHIKHYKEPAKNDENGCH